MVEYRKGYFAKSIAGHDKGKTYIIIEGTLETGTEDFVLVSDGDRKKISTPKKKKTKHIQVVHQCDPRIEEKIGQKQEIKDEDIKRAIKSYNNRERDL